MSRQTECRDYSNGRFPCMAVIRANNHFHCVHVAERLSRRLVVFERYADGCPPRTRIADALDDVRMYMLRAGKYPEGQGPVLSPFAISFAWLLLAYGAIAPETALRLDIDPVRGLVGYIPELAGEIRFIGNQLLGCDPLLSEETLLDHLRGATALRGFLPYASWFCFEREKGEAGGVRYRFFFDAAGGDAEAQQERLVEILVLITSQALSYAPLALEGSRALFERMWKVGWYTEG